MTSAALNNYWISIWCDEYSFHPDGYHNEAVEVPA